MFVYVNVLSERESKSEKYIILQLEIKINIKCNVTH